MTIQFNYPGQSLMAAMRVAASIHDAEDKNLFVSSVTQECDLYHRVATAMHFWGQLVKDRAPGFQGDKELLILRMKLLTEEFKELWEKGLGIKCTILLGETDQQDDCIERTINDSDSSKWDFVEFADALGDIRVVNVGTDLAFGIPTPLVDWEIHCSNMSKLGPDGPIMNGVSPGYAGDPAFPDLADTGFDPNQPVGKILKGPNYVAPNLEYILNIDSQEGEV